MSPPLCPHPIPETTPKPPPPPNSPTRAPFPNKHAEGSVLLGAITALPAHGVRLPAPPNKTSPNKPAAGSGLLSELQLSLRTECACQPTEQASLRTSQPQALDCCQNYSSPCARSAPTSPTEPASLRTSQPQALDCCEQSQLSLRTECACQPLRKSPGTRGSVLAPLPTSPPPNTPFSLLQFHSHHPNPRSHAAPPTRQPHSRFDGYSPRWHYPAKPRFLTAK